MSIYGKVKRVGSSSFQFDRVYPSRLDMEYVLNDDGTKASARKDGVYIGRYVLVEYGERYGADQQELDSYIQSREKDVQEYGNTYDSTVWQKVYENNNEKYIMVAELNATVPHLSLNLQDTITYEPDEQSQNIYYKVDTNQLEEITNVKEIYNEPMIEKAIQAEDNFILNFPRPLELEINNENINFNADGFDMAYRHNLSSGENKIVWAAKDLSENNQTSKKSLYMQVPIFGNTVSSLYDLLYGQAKAKERIRPYLQKFRDNYYLNEAEVDDLKTFLEQFKGINIQGKSETELRNLVSEKLPELTSDKDTLLGKWSSNIPNLGAILGNNSVGLLGIFEKMFGVSDPITGITRFYLYNDWLNDPNANENSPAIINKPLVIGGYDDNDKFSGGHYTINFDSWKIAGEPITEIKAYCEASTVKNKETISVPVIQLDNKVYIQVSENITADISILLNVYNVNVEEELAENEESTINNQNNIVTCKINTGNLVNDNIPTPKKITFTKDGYKSLTLKFYKYLVSNTEDISN